MVGVKEDFSPNLFLTEEDPRDPEGTRAAAHSTSTEVALLGGMTALGVTLEAVSEAISEVTLEVVSGVISEVVVALVAAGEELPSRPSGKDIYQNRDTMTDADTMIVRSLSQIKKLQESRRNPLREISHPAFSD